MANKIIAFDVDGVLINSEKEILLTSWNEYNIWRKEKGLSYQEFTVSCTDIPNFFIETYNAFRSYTTKSYHRIAVDLLMFEEVSPHKINYDVIQQISEADESKKDKIISRVKVIRSKIREESNKDQIIESYHQVDYEWIEKIYAEGKLYLITNNPFSISDFANIAFKPDSKYVRTSESGITNKSIHLKNIMKEIGISPHHVFFVDDSLDVLKEIDGGTDIPSNNLFQNSWAPKSKFKSNSVFQILDFTEIKAKFENLNES